MTKFSFTPSPPQIGPCNECAAPQYCGEGDYGGLAQLVEQRIEDP